MLISKLTRNPDYGDRLQARRIYQKLAQMAMICPLHLIFDEDPVRGPHILAKNIGTKRAHVLLLCLNLQIQANRVPQNGKVIRPSEPWREISRL